MKLGHNHKAAWHALRKIGRATFNQLADEMGCEVHTAKKNIYRLRELGLAVMSAKSSNVMFFSAICNGEEIEFASYVKNRNDQAKRIYEAFIEAKNKKNPHVLIHICSDVKIHGNRGTAQRTNTKSHGFSSGERVA